MRIRHLRINRFGHFTERDLAFQGSGLHVVYGPNEAGKTTLLEFLRGILFDFHKDSKKAYDFGGAGDVGGVATLELRDGRTIELRRRKGNKNKVSIKLDGQATDLDDAGWLRLLDRADRSLFESVFAFGLDQLSQGETTLKHDSLQSALFSGSLGGAISPDKTIAELTRQADELFKKSGGKPAINALLSEHKKLVKEIKECSLRPDKYRDAESAVATATANALDRQRQVDRLRLEHSQIEKRVRAWPKWWELHQRRDERATLCVPANIPIDVRQRYQIVSKQLESVSNEQATCKSAMERTEGSLKALTLDPSVISYQAEIKACASLRQSFIEAKRDLPERRRQRDAMRAQIDRELAELRPGWGHNELLAFSVDVATRAEFDRQIRERRELGAARATLSAKRDGDVTNRDHAKDVLAAIGVPRDLTALATVLGNETDFVANRKQLDNVGTELTALERKLASQRRKLSPPMADAMPNLHELTVPRVEAVNEFADRFSEVHKQLHAVAISVEQDEDEKRKLEEALANPISGHAVPTLSERDSARDKRDAGWNLVRRRFISAEHIDSEIHTWLGDNGGESLPDVYEIAVRRADDLADQIYDHASEVAHHEGLRRQVAALAARIDQKRQRIVTIEKKQAELKSKWMELWQSCGFEPLAPDIMRGWLNDHEAFCAIVANISDLGDIESRLRSAIDSFEQRLRAASDSKETDMGLLLTSAKLSLEKTKEEQRKVSESQALIHRLEKQIAKHEGDLAILAIRETNTNDQWRSILTQINLPDSWDAELAREVIDKLSATRVRLDSLPEEEARIQAMQARIEEFEQRVRALCKSIAPELQREPPELAIEKISEQVERAVEAQRKHDDLSNKYVEERARLDGISHRHSQHIAERDRLFALAEATTEEAFLQVVSRVEKAAKLDSEIEQLKRELDLIRAGDNRTEFETSLIQSELPVLQGQLHDLEERLREQESLKSAANEAVGAARTALASLDGTSRVAALAEQLQQRRAVLASEIDRYMPLIFARHLLSAAVDRFEKENQPEMVATISSLLRQMTAEKYIEFDRMGGESRNILIRRHDGVERTPDQLSTATREQLYLAIRLAYVIHYCKTNEPLPIIFDDVLVNFDDARAARTMVTLADISQAIPVMMFTCHPHLVQIAREAVPDLMPLELAE